jgi:peptidoglycan hydrolase-like protein with peptidoglycan-binding domain
MTFALGSLGNGTREIQRGLNRLGYGLNVDGEFGPLTDAAVRKFQTANGLEVDGIVGPITWAALIKAVNALTQKEG